MEIVVKRLFCFASYHEDNSISEADFEFMESLSKYGDIYLYSDNSSLNSKDIERALSICKDATFSNHGEYDFGSWKRMISSISNDDLELYDELYIVNNSVYLVNELTKFIDGFSDSSHDILAPCLLDEHYSGSRMHFQDYFANFDALSESAMLPSFFLGFKLKAFLTSPIFPLFESVKKEKNRLDVCYKYERELSRIIFRLNFSIMYMYEFVNANSFVYTSKIFPIIKNGFPFFKKKLALAEYYPVLFLAEQVVGIRDNCSGVVYNELKEVLKKYHGLEIFTKYEDSNTIPILNESPPLGLKEKIFKKLGRSKGNNNRNPHQISKSYLSPSFYLDNNLDVYQNGCDPLEHFSIYGKNEGRQPNPWINRRSFEYVVGSSNFSDLWNGNLAKSQIDSYEDYISKQLDVVDGVYKASDLYIFFNVAKDVIGGGMLSINRFLKHTDSYFKDSLDSKSKVCLSGLPLANPAIDYSKFESHLPMVEFDYLVEGTDPKLATIFLPECFAVDFFNDLSNRQKKWLIKRKVKVVIMNQNNDLMPTKDELFSTEINKIATEVIITTAHKSYCNQREASKYTLPIKQLTPFLPEMNKTSLREKNKVIMCSPDVLRDDVDGITSNTVFSLLKESLPDYKVIIVRDMTLEKYLELASNCAFSITFGEGMDGYFIEPVLAGAVSFAVFNNSFFPPEFECSSTVYSSWKSLLQNIVNQIRALESDESMYERVSLELSDKLGRNYSNKKSTEELRDFLSGELDYYPNAYLKEYDNYSNEKRILESQFNFSHSNISDGLVLSKTNDNIVIQHRGGTYYKTLLDTYSNRVWEIPKGYLEPGYRMIFVGSGYGVSPIILAKQVTPSSIVCFESAYPTAILCKENLAFNLPDVTSITNSVKIAKKCKSYTSTYFPDVSSEFDPIDDSLIASQNERSNFQPTKINCYSADLEFLSSNCIKGEMNVLVINDIDDFSAFDDREKLLKFSKIVILVSGMNEFPLHLLSDFKLFSKQSDNNYTIYFYSRSFDPLAGAVL
ncbi:rhamnan synthesis F family protein [Vibrio mexicanus]|uniref:rhamnan synthesis F family protein n=1 Tax=Vibrio mexicanus TaxID=1004326 RepID=UPI00063CA83A|nr:rhamnan synthesis F family protein [Vibrio mexicanus]